MTLRVIDIETTGTDPVTDAIIEIASVDLLADGAIAHRQATFVGRASRCRRRPRTAAPTSLVSAMGEGEIGRHRPWTVGGRCPEAAGAGGSTTRRSG
jgi:hypothetical protein